MKICFGYYERNMTLEECKHASTPIEVNVSLWFDNSNTLDDPEQYKRLIGKLIYLTVTRLDITFDIDVLSRFMHQHREAHWSAALRIQSCPGKGLMYRKHEHVHISGLL